MIAHAAAVDVTSGQVWTVRAVTALIKSVLALNGPSEKPCAAVPHQPKRLPARAHFALQRWKARVRMACTASPNCSRAPELRAGEILSG